MEEFWKEKTTWFIIIGAMVIMIGSTALAQDDISFIKILLGYKEVGVPHSNNVFNFTFNGETGVTQILSADINFNTLTVIQNNTPTRFNLTINNSRCSNDYNIQNYGKTANIPQQLQLYYSCGNRITNTGFYFVNLSSNQSFNNTYGWAEITYKNTLLNSLNMNITNLNNTLSSKMSLVATEYYIGEDAIVSAMVSNGNTPITTASCLLTAFYPNRTTKLLNGATMGLVENGVYMLNISRNNFTFVGNYPLYVNCSFTVLLLTTVTWAVGEINIHNPPPSPNGNLLVTGTEYFIGEDANPSVLDLNVAGSPINTASCLITAFNPSKTKLLNGASLTFLENGVYFINISRANFTVVGTYPFYINCTATGQTIWALGEMNFHDDININETTLLQVGNNITNANFTIQQNVTTTISNHQTSLFAFLNANFTDTFSRLTEIKNTLLMHDLSMKNNFTYMDNNIAANFTNTNLIITNGFASVLSGITDVYNLIIQLMRKFDVFTSETIGEIF